MCRMIAIVSSRQITSGLMDRFRQLAERGKVLSGAKPGHKDGWGIVCYQNGVPIYLGRNPEDATSDSRYEEACDNLAKLRSTGPLLAHLRKASPEYKKVSVKNTAPFVMGNLCFAHNGTIYNFRAKVEGLKGTTDSERLFRMILRERELRRYSMDKAIRSVVLGVRESFRFSSLTFLLSDGVRTYAYREYSNPKTAGYYNMMYLADEKRVIMSQEKILRGAWATIPNRSLVTVMKNQKVCIKKI